MTHIMVVGTSEPQDFELLNNGAAIDGSSLGVDIEWRAPAPSNPPTVAWLSAAAGTVRVTGAEGMAVGTYPFRFILTDGASDDGFAPNGAAPDVWRVVPV